MSEQATPEASGTMVYTLCEECDRALLLVSAWQDSTGQRQNKQGTWVHLANDGTPVPGIDAEDHDADPRDDGAMYGTRAAALRALVGLPVPAEPVQEDVRAEIERRMVPYGPVVEGIVDTMEVMVRVREEAARREAREEGRQERDAYWMPRMWDQRKR